ncbi:YajG family lipoprotein [Acidithiobacillus sp.]|uniref:YajG family lipoprotein n=1 Tax=Acidithiobacillus sp. TaxID=1872118 RepID=UPI00260C4CDA|nr:YajG family lipoprotein [Acidithiobacillus sp.]MDD5278715.1 YajG family lipoprotein [Acidithiobacillus sp.]
MMNNKLLKTAAKVAFLGVAFGLAGCAESAYFPDTIHNHYKAPTSWTKVPGAENVTVTVAVQDHKKRHNEVSRSEDMIGIQFAGVYLHIDKAFKAAMDTALEKRGFKIGGSGTNVQVVVQHFYLPEEMGLSTITHKGHLDMLVSIPSVGYHQSVRINGFKQDTGFTKQMTTLGAGRTASANVLMAKGIDQAVNNPGFIAALLKAGHAGVVVPRLSADG